MPRRLDLKGVHRVRSVKGGKVYQYHYAWRGGPCFWRSSDPFKPNTPEYLAALAAVAPSPAEVKRDVMAPDMVDRFLDSAVFKAKKPRTQADYRTWLGRFSAHFSSAGAIMFADPRSRGAVNEWRSQWSHSPKQYDSAVTYVSPMLNWAVDEGIIPEHHCHRMTKVYKADRAEIIWTEGDQRRFNDAAPEWARRVLGAALETGLRPGDLIKIGWQHIVEDATGARTIKVKTNKRGRWAHIPVTPRMAALLAETPRDRLTILVNARGSPLTEHRASEGVRQWRDKVGLSSDLRLQDARGTAATRLLRANASLGQIARVMGWSLRYAQSVIENYAAVDPEGGAEVLNLLEAARKRGQG